LGTIASVSTLTRSNGAAMPVCLMNGFILELKKQETEKQEVKKKQRKAILFLVS